MVYDIYLDVFFFVNFAMNLLLLACCGRILGTGATFWGCVRAAAFGAFAAAFFLLFRLDFPGAFAVVAVLMGRAAYGKSALKISLMRGAFLFFAAFLAEGIISWMAFGAGKLFFRHGLFGKTAFFYLAAGGLISFFLFGLIRGEAQNAKLVIPVRLTFKGKSKMLNGYYDTGNRLVEPVFGRPVHIAEYEAVKELMPESYRQAADCYLKTGTLELADITAHQMYEFTFLPYDSIGREKGQLLGIRVDSAVFYGKAGEKTENKAVVGLTEKALSGEGRYQMIINRRLEV